MNCPKCGDKVNMNAGHVCLTGNDRLKERITYLQARIAELEAEVVQYKKELGRVLEAHKKAVTRLNEWSPELAQDFVTLLLMDLQKKEVDNDW